MVATRTRGSRQKSVGEVRLSSWSQNSLPSRPPQTVVVGANGGTGDGAEGRECIGLYIGAVQLLCLMMLTGEAQIVQNKVLIVR